MFTYKRNLTADHSSAKKKGGFLHGHMERHFLVIKDSQNKIYSFVEAHLKPPMCRQGMEQPVKGRAVVMFIPVGLVRWGVAASLLSCCSLQTSAGDAATAQTHWWVV